MKFAGLFILCLLFIFGCGKEIKDKPSQFVESQPFVSEEIAQQNITCREDTCPSGIAKIVILDKQDKKFCTGFLTDFDTLATSASCLPDLLRWEGADCRSQIHVFFPETFNRKMERVGCFKVLKASNINTRVEQNNKPGLWRNDIAFLKLDKSFKNRRLSAFSREGLAEKTEHIVWAVHQVDDRNAEIQSKTCLPAFNSFLNPMATHEASPNMLMANCSFLKGHTGAPILDGFGRVRGIVSVDTDQKTREFLKEMGLLKHPLKVMLHATNMACAPTIYDSEVMNETECSKRLDIDTMDRRRADMVSDHLFGGVKEELERKLETNNPYLKLGVKLVGDGEHREVVYYPKCFKKLEDWIDTARVGRRGQFNFSTPIVRKKYKMWMDEFARVIYEETNLAEQTFHFQLSLGFLRQNRSATVYMWNLADIDTSFQNVTEKCDLLF